MREVFQTPVKIQYLHAVVLARIFVVQPCLSNLFIDTLKSHTNNRVSGMLLPIFSQAGLHTCLVVTMVTQLSKVCSVKSPRISKTTCRLYIGVAYT